VADLAASGSRVLFRPLRYFRAMIETPALESQVTDLGAFSGPIGGPFEPLYGRRDNGGRIDQQLDLDGSMAVYEASGCNGVAVRDLATLGSPRCFPGVLRKPRLAGRFLAAIAQDLSSTGRIIVFDHRTGEEVYRIETSPSGEPVSFRAVDVQDDGTIAFAYQSSEEGGRIQQRLGWASPASPTAHALPTPARAGYQVRLAGGRIAYMGSQGRPVPPTAELGLVNLTGDAPRVLARRLYGDLFNDTLDFDGTRVTWVGPTCQGPRIYIRDVDDLMPAVTPMRRCPLKLRGGARIDRRGRVALRVACAGLTFDCASGVTVHTARRYRLDGRTIPAGRRLDINDSPRGSKIRVKLSRLGKRLLAAQRRLRVRLTASLGDDTLGRETRTTRATLKP
jgi:hypothetical protein